MPQQLITYPKPLLVSYVPSISEGVFDQNKLVIVLICGTEAYWT